MKTPFINKEDLDLYFEVEVLDVNPKK